MLAALFIQGGINALRAPAAHAQAAKPVFHAMAPVVDKVVEAAPVDRRPEDETFIKIDGAVKIIGGSMLALGIWPRVAATALAGSLVATTAAAHRFWEESDPQREQDQQIHFLKNVGLLGGLLIAAADTEGKPSLAWRGRTAAKRTAAVTASQADALSGATSHLTGRVTGAAHDAGAVVAGLAGMAPAARAALASRASHAGSDLSSRVGDISTELSRRAAKARREAKKRRAKLQKRAAKRSTRLQKTTAQRLKMAGPLREQAGLLGHDIAARASVVGHEVAHQAEELAKDARKRAHALNR
jgi:uncharacterized membrane protein YphA (DoxX/SURF4 family)